MPRKDRRLFPGAIYHIFDRGVAKSPIFYDDEDRHKFLEIIDELYIAYNFVIHAFCLMGNHYHLLLETYEPNLPELMQRFMCKYVKYFNKKYSRPGYLFQDRYDDRNVYTEQYFVTLFRYFALNPVEDRPGIAPQDCIWSSYYDYYYAKERYPFLKKDLFELLFKMKSMDFTKVDEFVNCLDDCISEKFLFDEINFNAKDRMTIPRLVTNGERKQIIVQEVDSMSLLARKKRKILVFLFKKYTTYSDKLIAKIAGYSSFSSISRIYNNVKKSLQKDSSVMVLVEEIESKIRLG